MNTPPPIPEDLLLRAYRIGIFPMSDARDDPEIFWVEPKRRAILPLDGFICSRSLARTLRRGRFTVTCNAGFAEVLAKRKEDRKMQKFRCPHCGRYIGKLVGSTDPCDEDPKQK